MIERWPVSECIHLVEMFIRTNSVTAIQQDFRRHFNRHNAPSRNTMSIWVRKWHEEGSVKDVCGKSEWTSHGHYF